MDSNDPIQALSWSCVGTELAVSFKSGKLTLFESGGKLIKENLYFYECEGENRGAFLSWNRSYQNLAYAIDNKIMILNDKGEVLPQRCDFGNKVTALAWNADPNLQNYTFNPGPDYLAVSFENNEVGIFLFDMETAELKSCCNTNGLF